MPPAPQSAADSPPLPEAAALAAAGLNSQNAAAGLALLRRLTGAKGSGSSPRAAKWRAALLRLHLRYERLRLGHDAQSLSLLLRAAAAGRPVPPLSVGQWLFLLDFCHKNA